MANKHWKRRQRQPTPYVIRKVPIKTPRVPPPQARQDGSAETRVGTSVGENGKARPCVKLVGVRNGAAA